MELILDSSNSKYQIRSYEPGKILINEKIYTQSIIITPTNLLHPWIPDNAAELSVLHLTEIIKLQPDVVLIGTGAKWQMINPALLTAFYQAHIGIEIMDTAAACRTFNLLAADERNVAAALLIH
jgi:uncharacterized protein